MSEDAPPAKRLLGELRRRHVFRTAALYIVGTWLVLQVADVVFPALDISEQGIRYILIAALLGFPAVLVFGWFYDVGVHGIRRTAPAGSDDVAQAIPLRRSDYIILTALVGVVIAILYSTVGNVVEEPGIVREPAVEGPPVLAVLPFVSESLEGDSEFFAIGVHDDLLTQLALLQSMRVISRTSVLEYKDTMKNIREIGAELGADAVLEGGVQSAGDRIRINAQLIDARTDEHLWAQTYDRELSAANIFDVQTDISRAIASAMDATLTEQDDAQLSAIPTENMAAYRAYHKAMQILDTQGSFMKDDLRLALEEAVALDPTFTRAWAELAGHLAFQNFWEEYRPEFVGRTEEIIEIIREIAPGSADYLMAQAYFAYYTLKDYDLAHDFVSQAIAMRPSDTRLLMLKTWIERRQGDFDARIETIRLARTLDPRDPKWTEMLVNNLGLTHRYDEAMEELQDSNIESYNMEAWHGLLQLSEHRDIDRWVADLERVHKMYEESADLANLQEAYIAKRDYDAAASLLPLLREDYDNPQVGNPHLSDRNIAEIVTYWLSGKTDLLEQSVQRGRAHLDRSRSPDGSFEHKDLIGDVALIEAAQGNTEDAEKFQYRALRAMEADKASITAWSHYACRVFAMANASDAAVECLRKVFTEPSGAQQFLEARLPYYDSIREEAEFVDLVREFENTDD
jgi:TolB-like protein